MEIGVRRATGQDAYEALVLWEKGKQPDASPIFNVGTREDMAANIGAGNVFVAETDQPAGILGLISVCAAGDPGIQTIGNIVVRPDMRGAGVGAALVAAAATEARTRGGKVLLVLDRTPGRESKLYRNFAAIGELREMQL